MEHIWSPWRYRYVSQERSDECIFCALKSEYILHRAEHNFVLLNLYPYTSGHLMIAPYRHVATLADSAPAALQEMMVLAQRAEIALKKVYKAAGFNAGLNIGEAAGAGVAGHIHMHVLPRWPGDANFMTTVAETRVLPEDLETTYKRLLEVF